jgi:hypothetical protein
VELLQKGCMFGLQEQGENLMHHFVFGLLFLHVHNKVLDEHFAMHVVIISLLKICFDHCYQILGLDPIPRL